MKIQAIRTPRVQCGDNLEVLLEQSLPALKEKDLVVITSKVVSLSQGWVAPVCGTCKRKLIEQEADWVADVASPYGVSLTITRGLLLCSAGIDESNASHQYILYPREVQKTLRQIWDFLRQKKGLQEVGVLMTDSRTTPLRRGVVGVGLGWCGFEPFYSYIGKLDLDGRPLRTTQVNLLDALSAAAVLAMGEGDEQTPLALIQEVPHLTFVGRPPTGEEEASLCVPLEEDLYAPLFQGVSWVKGEGGG